MLLQEAIVEHKIYGNYQFWSGFLKKCAHVKVHVF